MYLHREFTSSTGKVFEVLKIKVCTEIVVRWCYDLLAFVTNF